ncbi:MAG: DUF2007 domain-containing protein [Chloroflexi bacterium]|nr:DUF2007 domain-containing protein [Chloroflexota bacterium]
MNLQSRDSGADPPYWVAVYITHNVQEAHVIAGKLQTCDIASMIHQEAGAAAIGITLGNLGEIKVLVSPKDYERAAEVLFPASAEQIEASNDRLQLIWHGDDEGSEDETDDEE